MKAKELAGLFKPPYTLENVQDALLKLVLETKEIADQRKIQTDDGLVSIFNQQQEKWEAFLRIRTDVAEKFKDAKGLYKYAQHTIVPISKEIWP